MAKHEISVGEIFNHFEVIGEPFVSTTSTSKNQRVLCRCRPCGTERILNVSDLKCNKRQSCGCVNLEEMRRKKYAKNGPDNPHWRGSGEISASFWYAVQQGAMHRGHEFKITIEYASALFEEQNRRCALSGEPLTFANHIALRERRFQANASLDRIDSTVGYIVGNVQWVDKQVNWIKQRLTNETLIAWCRKIANHSEQSP